ncbi:MAG: CobW family GTP-binding protein [Bradymonadia bacterium]
MRLPGLVDLVGQWLAAAVALSPLLLPESTPYLVAASMVLALLGAGLWAIRHRAVALLHLSALAALSTWAVIYPSTGLALAPLLVGALLQYAAHSVGRQIARRGTRPPLHVLTGFLGSGKTTLLNRLLSDPSLAGTAVIVNEFGEVGVDHVLLEAVDEQMMLLSSGCVCCTVRGDLVQTVEALHQKVATGVIPPFDRIVLETTGVADPAPILQTLMASRRLRARCTPGVVVTVVDAMRPTLLDAQTLDPVAIAQVALADRLVLSKLDLDPEAESLSTLQSTLRSLNGRAEYLSGDDVRPRSLFAPVRGHGVDHEHHHHTHAHHNVSTFTVELPDLLSRGQLESWLLTLMEQYGPDLLRVKGLARLRERPRKPAVIHVVQHMVAPLSWLDRWPSDSQVGRCVFIGRGLDRAMIEGLLHGRVSPQIHTRTE